MPSPEELTQDSLPAGVDLMRLVRVKVTLMTTVLHLSQLFPPGVAKKEKTLFSARISLLKGGLWIS